MGILNAVADGRLQRRGAESEMRNHILLKPRLTPMTITVSLQQPRQSTPVQEWTFENQPVIKIGRSSDNHIILPSSVVSRRHIEIRHIATHWKLIDYSNNGTYLDGERITTIFVEDGMIIKLAACGPMLLFNLGLPVRRVFEAKP